MTMSLESDPGQVHLKPGEMHFACRPTVVQTLLGSCVSVTLYNSRMAVGSICHAMLPRCDQMECYEGDSIYYRHVDCSVIKMVVEFKRLGIGTHEIEAKIIGGANMFESCDFADEFRRVGNQNIDMAFTILEKEKIRLVTSHVGGSLGRKLLFYSHTGEVFVQRVKRDYYAQHNIAGSV